MSLVGLTIWMASLFNRIKINQLNVEELINAILTARIQTQFLMNQAMAMVAQGVLTPRNAYKKITGQLTELLKLPGFEGQLEELIPPGQEPEQEAFIKALDFLYGQFDKITRTEELVQRIREYDISRQTFPGCLAVHCFGSYFPDYPISKIISLITSRQSWLPSDAMNMLERGGGVRAIDQDSIGTSFVNNDADDMVYVTDQARNVRQKD